MMVSRFASSLALLGISVFVASCADVTRRDDDDDDGSPVTGTTGSPDPSDTPAGSSGADEGPGDPPTGAGGADGGTGGACSSGILWLDEAPIRRTRTRFVYPELTGDDDGFLFVTTERVPDRCEGLPCVRVEHLPSSGDDSVTAWAAFQPSSDRIRVFAGTDPAGAGHFAAAMDTAVPGITGASMGEELVWGAGTEGAAHPARRALDPLRGLGTVAFDADHAWIVTHDWEMETTVGEGFSYPIAPEVERLSTDGSSAIVPGLDPTQGQLFLAPRLALSERSSWLVTSGFFPGPLRAGGPGWTGVLPAPRATAGRFAVVAQRSGALVFVGDFDGVTEIGRVAADGSRMAGPPLPPSASGSDLALATDGEKVVLAHRATEGAVHITVFDATLATLATGAVPGMADVGDHATLQVAAAVDGSFAVLVAPFPVGADHQAQEPVHLVRFRQCD